MEKQKKENLSKPKGCRVRTLDRCEKSLCVDAELILRINNEKGQGMTELFKKSTDFSFTESSGSSPGNLKGFFFRE